MRHKLQRALAAASADVRAVLHRALDRPGRGLGAAESEALLRCRARDDVVAVLAAADEARHAAVGDVATYVVNRNINFTNSCTKRCGFCAFSRTAVDGESYLLPTAEVVRRAEEAVRLGRAPRRAAGVHLHAVAGGGAPRRRRRPVADFLADARRAGVDSLPGTSAEILDDGVRATLAKGRLTTAEWLDVVETAHAAGLPTTATMMFGHVEDAGHVARHFSTIRALAERTGMVSEFVPLPFVSTEAPMYKDPARRAALGVRGGTTRRSSCTRWRASRSTAPWTTSRRPGPRSGSAATLLAGANDLGGVLMNESISVAAGARGPARDARRSARPRRARGAAAAALAPLAAPSTTRRSRPRSSRATRSSRGAATGASATPSPGAATGGGAAVPPPAGERRAADVVTYSSCYTVVPTYECFNKCAYCSFRAPIAGGRGDWKSKDDVRADLERVAASGVCEVLVLAGEVRFDSPKRRAWHAMMVDACEAALELDLLPHTNVDARVRDAGAAAAGRAAPPGPEQGPALRMEQLDMAGRLRVPFTTGILCGIGETADDRLRSLDVIAEPRFGHAQECIIQPFSPDPALARFAPGAAPDLPALVAAARAAPGGRRRPAAGGAARAAIRRAPGDDHGRGAGRRRAAKVPAQRREPIIGGAHAVLRASEDGVARQRLRTLLPRGVSRELIPPDETWTGGIMQLYQACAPLVRDLLRSVGSARGDAAPTVREQRLDASGVDGEALMVAEAAEARLDASAFVQPSLETQKAIEDVAAAAGPRLVLMVNPQFRDSDDTLDFLASKAGFLGQLGGFLGGKAQFTKRMDELGFVDVFSLQEYVTTGTQVRIFLSYPHDWQIFALSDRDDEPAVKLGESKERPDYNVIAEVLAANKIEPKIAQSPHARDQDASSAFAARDLSRRGPGPRGRGAARRSRPSPRGPARPDAEGFGSSADARRFLHAVDPSRCADAHVIKGENENEPDVHVCMDFLKRNEPCVVYSIGIANNWLFDDLMLFSFDPTMSGDHKRHPERHTFEPIGIGAATKLETRGAASTANYGGRARYRVETLADMMARHGHDAVTVLRMDVEGAEWDVLAECATSRDGTSSGPREIGGTTTGSTAT
ncbi:hypothetical protein JL721_9054 [Aureococcus anophagefferens]|nr:hypothetical protein JL721_9054 [Aureococcus anophagefferens]